MSVVVRYFLKKLSKEVILIFPVMRLFIFCNKAIYITLTESYDI